MPDSHEDIEIRVTVLEREVVRLCEQVTLSSCSFAATAAARALAAGVDHDVSEVHAELRAHTQAFNALRETQLEQCLGIAGLDHKMTKVEQKVTEGFAIARHRHGADHRAADSECGLRPGLGARAATVRAIGSFPVGSPYRSGACRTPQSCPAQLRAWPAAVRLTTATWRHIAVQRGRFAAIWRHIAVVGCRALLRDRREPPGSWVCRWRPPGVSPVCPSLGWSNLLLSTQLTLADRQVHLGRVGHRAAYRGSQCPRRSTRRARARRAVAVARGEIGETTSAVQCGNGGVVMVASRATSYRMDPRVKARLEGQAVAEGITERALLERLVVEGLDTLQHPGIVYRDGPTGRRAALAVGPDVWEVVSALRYTGGSDAERVAALAEQFDLHPRHIRIAIDFAAAHREDITAQVAVNDAAAERARQLAEQRAHLMAS